MGWVTICEDVTLDEAGEALVKSLMEDGDEAKDDENNLEDRVVAGKES